MAKCLHLGYSLADVVDRATLGPARMIDDENELGSLSPGTVADLTVFRIVDAPTVLTDSLGKIEVGSRDVEPVHCIRAGGVISEVRLPPRADPDPSGR